MLKVGAKNKNQNILTNYLNADISMQQYCRDDYWCFSQNITTVRFGYDD